MMSNFKLFRYFNISHHFIQNVQKQKNLCPELPPRSANETQALTPVISSVPVSYSVIDTHNRQSKQIIHLSKTNV